MVDWWNIATEKSTKKTLCKYESLDWALWQNRKQYLWWYTLLPFGILCMVHYIEGLILSLNKHNRQKRKKHTEFAHELGDQCTCHVTPNRLQIRNIKVNTCRPTGSMNNIKKGTCQWQATYFEVSKRMQYMSTMTSRWFSKRLNRYQAFVWHARSALKREYQNVKSCHTECHTES